MVVWKVYPAHGRALHERLRHDRAGRAGANDVKLQVLVQLHLTVAHYIPRDHLLELRATLLAASALVLTPATVALALSLLFRWEAWNTRSTKSTFCFGSEMEKEEREV
ncbi:hypothetical protein ACP4OV_006363 [Aristida adscensionis]